MRRFWLEVVVGSAAAAARSLRTDARPCVQPVSQWCRFRCVSDAADAAVS